LESLGRRATIKPSTSLSRSEGNRRAASAFTCRTAATVEEEGDEEGGDEDEEERGETNDEDRGEEEVAVG